MKSTYQKKNKILSGVDLIEKRLPLTPTQEGIIFSSVYSDKKPIYLSQATITFTEEISADKLWRAWEKVFQRHEILRSRLTIEKDGNYCLEVIKEVSLVNEFYDFSDLTIKLGKKKSDNFAIEDRAQEFDLFKGPLLRCSLFKLAPKQYIMVCTYHHLLMCAQSAVIILKDLFDFYQDKKIGKQKAVYSDFIRDNQYIFLNDKQEVYWKEVLKNHSESTLLPYNKEKSKDYIKIFYIKDQLDKNVIKKLKNFSHSEGLSLNILCQAAWGLLLAKYSTQHDIVFGAVRSYPRPLIKSVVGLFINTLPIRIKYDDKTRIGDVLKSLKLQHKGLKKYFYHSPSKILKQTSFHKVNELFSTAVDFKPEPINRVLKLYDKIWGSRKINILTETHYPLLLEITGGQEAFDVSLSFDGNIFSAEEAEEILLYWKRILNIITKKNLLVKEICLLTEDEYREIVTWGSGGLMSYEYNSFADYLSFSMENNRSKIAATDIRKKLTYTELSFLVECFCSELQSYSLEKGDVVAVYLEPSVELLISILSLLKLGLVYLPLDSRTTPHLINFMLKDSEVKAIITNVKNFCENFNFLGIVIKPISTSTKYRKIELDKRCNVKPDDSAYIIYTSGTTGYPKGVVGTHAGLLNRILWMRNHYQVSFSDKILHKTSINFDVSLWELLLPITSGAELVIAKKGGDKNFSYLKNIIKENKITIVHFVPSLLYEFVRSGKLNNIDSLRVLVCSGERLSPLLKDKVYQVVPGVKLENLYGPTEASIDVSYWTCEVDCPEVYIGRPIKNINIYILDRYKKVVAVGIIGELYISGAGLAKGYKNNLELTEQNFIYVDINGKKERCYKTGDLASWSRNGFLKYHGRVDEQIKLRGIRVELSGIEAVLDCHPKILKSVALVDNSEGGSSFIIYLICEKNELENEEVYKYLSAHHFGEVFPKKIIKLDKFPVLTSGKVDKKSLFDLYKINIANEHRGIKKETYKEKILIDVLREVLQIKNKISTNNNYFELGGDSIKTITICSKLESMGYTLNIKDVFRHQRIDYIAGSMSPISSGMREKCSYSKFSMIQPTDKSRVILETNILDAWPLSKLQEGMFVEEHKGSLIYRDIFAYNFSAVLDKDRMVNAINLVVESNPILTSVFNLSDYSLPLQLIFKEKPPVIRYFNYKVSSVSDAIKIKGEFIQKLKLELVSNIKSCAISFDILNFGTYGFTLIINFSHALLDGLSVSILVKQLFKCYKADCSEEVKKNDMLVPYAYIEKMLISLDSYKKFWAAEINETFISSILENDDRKSYLIEGQSNLIEYDFPLGEVLALKTFSKENKISMKSTLLLIHALVIKSISRSSDVVIGTVESCRTDKSIKLKDMGLFINTVPLIFKLKTGKWREMGQQIHSKYLEVSEYSEYPLANILKLSGRSKIFDCLFYFTQFDSYEDLIKDDELSFEGIDVYEQTEFPLAVNFYYNFSCGALKLRIIYNTTSYNDKEINSIVGNYKKYSRLILDDGESISLCHDKSQPPPKLNLNNTSKLSLRELLFESMKRNAGSIAVIQNEKRLEYSVLLNKSFSLAKNIERKTEATDIICIYLKKDFNFIIALFAVVLSGRPFYMLSKEAANLDIKNIIQDTGAKSVITCSKWADKIVGFFNTCLYMSDEEDATHDTNNWILSPSENKVAYVIHTSGSSGKQKAVAIEYDSLLNVVKAAIDIINFSKEEVWISATSITFDIVILELLSPILAGGVIHLVDDEPDRVSRISNIISCQKKAVFQSTPSILIQLIETNNKLNGIKVISGGEVISHDLAKRILKSGASLWNFYGPTEATIWSTFFRVTEDILMKHPYVPIGKPIENMTACILDQKNNPLSYGKVGQLALSGEGLLMGYYFAGKLSKPVFSFINNKYFYLTGDMAFSNKDGVLAFAGRRDRQVKYNGIRLNLKEIEDALLNIKSIKKAISMIYKKHLIVFYDTSNNIEIFNLKEKLLSFLSKKILPNKCIHIKTWPLSSNGKIDCKKLLESIDSYPLDRQGVYNKVEDKFAEIWNKVLLTRNCRPYDDFFHVGGDSLLAARLVRKLNKIYNVKLTLKSFYNNPTPVGLIKEIACLDKNYRLPIQINEAKNNRRKVSLSQGQKRLVYLEEKNHSNFSYNIPVLFKLKGKVDFEKIISSLNILIEKHALFSFKYSRKNKAEAALVFDGTFCGVSATIEYIIDSVEALESQINKHVNQKLNLESPPFFKVIFLKASERESYMLFIIHHFVCDAFSLNILMNNFISICEGRASQIKHDEGFFDHIDFYDDWVNREEFLSQMNFWSSRLKNFLIFPDVFVGDKNIINENVIGAKTFSISTSLKNRIANYCQQMECSVFSFYLTTLCAVFYKLTDQHDLSFLSTVENRNKLELENSVGFIANTVILRNRINPKKNFKHNLKYIFDGLNSVLNNSTISFSDLINYFFSPKGIDVEKAIPIMFSYAKTEDNNFTAFGIDFERILVNAGGGLFNLSFNLESYGNHLRVQVDYKQKYFSKFFVDFLCDMYLSALDFFSSGNDSTVIGDISTSNIKNQQKNKVKSSMSLSSSRDTSFKDFIYSYNQISDKSIFYQEGHYYSLEDMRRKIDAVKNFFLFHKISDEELVAIYMEFNISLIIVILAAIEMSITYVPIDKNFDMGNVKKLLKDVAPQLVLVNDDESVKCLQNNLSVKKYSEILCENYSLNKQIESAHSKFQLKELMYIIYSSGTTGKPKGVMVSYVGILNTLQDLINRFSISQKDVILSVTSIGFDLSVFDIFIAVICRSMLVLPPVSQLKNPQAWLNILLQQNVTIWNSTPSSMQILLDYIDSASIKESKYLRLIMLSGEKISINLVNRIYKAFPNARVISLGGATEGSIWSIIYEVKETNATLPYGYAMKNQQLYVLNNKLETLPPYVKGGIYIGGLGVAKGYWRNAEKTKQNFIYHDMLDEKLFFTGDLGYFDEDGLLYIVGRIDNRLKIRGYSVEPNDIETCLLSCRGVQDVVVDVSNDEEDGRLTAYIIPKQGWELNDNYIFSFLSENIPTYMIPEKYVFLKKFPLNSNQKIDKLALRKTINNFEIHKATESHDYLYKIKKAWKEVLGVKKVHDNSNFFDLGGNSFLALDLSKNLNKIGFDIKVIDVFSFYTPSKLNTYIKSTKLRSLNENKKSKLRGSACRDNDVAIIGMAGRFPGSKNIAEYWNKLIKGEDLITRHFQGNKNSLDENIVYAVGHVESTEYFDYNFFNISEDEAKLIDPQQRLLMEVVWSSLEDAAYIPENFAGKIGIIAGTGINNYAYKKIISNKNLVNSIGLHKLQMLIDKDFIASRIAYILGLTGPAVSIGTACSTSLVAISQACGTLIRGEADIMVAAACSLMMPDDISYEFKPKYIFSKDGYCRALDDNATGTVPSSGVGSIVLKSLNKAIADGDNIYAVIKGSAINNDGGNKPSYMAPSYIGQEKCIRDALKNAAVRASEIDYVELHATGTRVGDPIEFSAVNKVYGKDRENGCFLGAVKSNIGHTDTASGIAGLIKTVFVLQQQKIPAVIHCKKINSCFEKSMENFIVNSQVIFSFDRQIQYAAISNFGIGGTNAHAILKSYVENNKKSNHAGNGNCCIINFSAPTRAMLRNMIALFGEFLVKNDSLELSSIAFTLHLGRKEFLYRSSIVCSSIFELKSNLPLVSIKKIGVSPCIGFNLNNVFSPPTKIIYELVSNFKFDDELLAILDEDNFKVTVDKLKAYCKREKIIGVVTGSFMVKVEKLIALILLTTIFFRVNITPEFIIVTDLTAECAAAIVLGSLKLKEAIQLILCQEGSKTELSYFKSMMLSNIIGPENINIKYQKNKIVAVNSLNEICDIINRDYWASCKFIKNKNCLSNDNCMRNIYWLDFDKCDSMKRVMQKISSLWLLGESLDWNALYQRQEVKRISLPGLVLESKRVWLEEKKLKSSK